MEIDISTDYEYMVYHLRKDFTFRDPDRPDDFAFVKYDEYVRKKEAGYRQIVGSIDRWDGRIRAYAKCPAEFTTRLVSLIGKQDLYIDLDVFKEGRLRTIFVRGIRAFSDFNPEDY